MRNIELLNTFLNTPKKKIIIGKDNETIDHILRKFVKGNESIAFDFEKYTLLSLARTIYMLSNESSSHILISSDQAAMLMYSFLVDNDVPSGRKIFGLIPHESLSWTTAKVVYQSINKIRTGKAIEGKTTGLEKLIEEFENHLNENGYLDEVGVTRIAISTIKDDLNKKTLGFDGDISVGILSSLEGKLTYLDEALLKAAFGENTIYVDLKSTSKGKNKKVKAYGFGNEVNYVIDDIISNNINVNDVAIYLSDSKYKNLIKAYFENHSIPYYLACGDNALCNDAMSLFDSILEFYSEHYSITALKNIISNPLIPQDLKFLGSLGYLSADKEQIVYAAENAKTPLDEPVFSELQINFLKRIVSFNEINSDSLFDNIAEYISELVEGKEEAKKINALNGEMKKVMDLLPRNFNESKKIQTIRDYIASISIKQDKPGKSYVYVSMLKSASYLDRKHNYFLGLSANQIYAKEYESPLISDSKLEECLDRNYYVSLAKRTNDEMVSSIKGLIDTSDGSIHFIRSTYDSVEFKPLAASILYISAEAEEEINAKNNYLGLDIKYQSVPDAKESWISSEAVSKIKSKKTFSPSAIETLMHCPLQFIYSYSYLFDSIDCDEFDGMWLKGGERGTLAHAILEDYQKKRLPEYDGNELDKSYYHQMAKAKKENHFENEIEQNKEGQRILEKIKQYLNRYYADKGEYKVLACEYDLEFDYEYDETNHKSIHVKGTADRIDGYVDENNTLHLKFVDYKTTNEKTFDDKYAKTKELAQLCLYPKGAESYASEKKEEIERIVGPFDDVETSNIPFVYEMLFGDKHLSHPSSTDFERAPYKEKMDSALKRLFSFLEHNDKDTFSSTFGTFKKKKASDFDNGLCSYCKFATICQFKLDNGDQFVADGLEKEEIKKEEE